MSGFKHDLFSQFARVGKALSNGNRLELLELLAQGERSVEDLANVCGLTIGNTSQHLKQLRLAGLVKSRKQGLKVYYQLVGDEVVSLLDVMRNVAEQNISDVQQLINSYLTVKDDLEPIPRDELMRRVKDDLVTVLDVRPAEEFAAGHVPGAINVPINELEIYLNNLQSKQEIVAYCRGPHCILAFDAVAKARDRGLTARRLEDGFPEWKLAGFPVATH